MVFGCAQTGQAGSFTQNISAVLGEMEFPFIDGYKPLRNYQRKLLSTLVSEALTAHPSIVRTVETEVDQPARVPSIADIAGAMQHAPRPRDKVARNATPRFQCRFQGNGGINYLDRESRNRSLGSASEEFVVNYERTRLSFEGKDRLAESVEWVSRRSGPHTLVGAAANLRWIPRFMFMLPKSVAVFPQRLRSA